MQKIVKSVILLSALALSLTMIWQCADQHSNTDIPGLNTGYYLNHNDTVKYVGMDVCRECHPLIYNTYIKTGMGESFDSATKIKSASLLHSGSLNYDAYHNLSYYPHWENDTLKIREYRVKQGDTTFSRTEIVDFIVGSGHHTNSHIFVENGYAYQIPFTFYTQDSILDFPPGFENGANSRYDRIIGLECMSCHNGFPEMVLGSENKYTYIPQGIDCERCHGPGEVHVKLKRAGVVIDTSKYIDYSIVNPAKLTSELQMDLCARCHLQGAMVLKPGKNYFDFKPGMHLTDVLDVFLQYFEGGEENFIMASHTERMMESKCYLASKDKFSCVSCHDPHVSTRSIRKDSYNKVCNNCHNSNASFCTLEEDKRLKAEYGCVECHMNKSGSRDIPHVRTHDHKISIPQTEEQKKEKRVFKGLVPINNHNTDSLTKARGYLLEFESFYANLDYLDSAFNYLDFNKNKNDEVYFNAIVRYFFLKKDYSKLIAFVEEKGIRKVLKEYLSEQDYSNYDAWGSYRIGQAYESNNNLMIAEYFYKNAIELAKYNLEFQNKYGSLLTKMDKIPEAKEVFEFVISEYPKYAPAHVNLGYAYVLTNDLTNARIHYETALSLDPDNIIGLINISALFIEQNDLKEANTFTNRILELDPENARAKYLLKEIGIRKRGGKFGN